MKTALLALEFPPAVGGVETYYAKLAEHWPDELVVIDNSRGELVRGKWPFFNCLPALFSIRRLWRSSRPDWVIAGELLPLGTAAWLMSRWCAYRYAVILHGYDFSLATKTVRKRWLSRWILARSHLIVCVNSRTTALVQAFVPGHTHVITINPGVERAALPLASDVEALAARYGLGAGPLLLTIGRLVERKGVDRVLEALPSVIKRFRGLRYAVIGRGPEEDRLREMIRRFGLEKYVILITDADEKAKQAWLAACDIFIMTARDIAGDYEGFGIVYLEAGAFGKPVIAGLSGGVGDAVQDGVNGLRVDETDPAAIARAIIALCEDAELRRGLGERGRKLAEKALWRDRIRRLYDALTSL